MQEARWAVFETKPEKGGDPMASESKTAPVQSDNQHLLILTKDNWEKEVLKSELPVLVDFWSETCGPCRMLLPTIVGLAKKYAGKVKVGKFNVGEEDNADIANDNRIMYIPAVILYKGGKELNRAVGPNPERFYDKMLEEVLR